MNVEQPEKKIIYFHLYHHDVPFKKINEAKGIESNNDLNKINDLIKFTLKNHDKIKKIYKSNYTNIKEEFLKQLLNKHTCGGLYKDKLKDFDNIEGLPISEFKKCFYKDE